MLSVKLVDGARLPKRATSYDAGYDLCSNEDKVVRAGQREFFDTGVSVRMPKPEMVGLNSEQYNLYGRVVGRSSLAKKKGVIVFPGTIDLGYEGTLGVIMFNMSDQDVSIRKGDKIAQLLLVPCLKVPAICVDEFDELKDNDRIGGFGSTGV